MSELHENDDVTVHYQDHPARTDSPEYGRTRKWLMETPGGCYICGGPVDLSHPEAADSKGMEDHHGAGIFMDSNGHPILVGMALAPLEWAGGWAADPKRVQRFAYQQWQLERQVAPSMAGDEPNISTTDDVMAWVDSPANASIKLCAAHHRAVPTQHTPDANGHEAVGIHHCPLPIFALQATCDWKRWDMWGGSSGTLAVAPHPSGGAVVLHCDPSHLDKEIVRAHQTAQLDGSPLVLDASHPVTRAATK